MRHQQQKDLFAMTEDSESGMMQSMVHREKEAHAHGAPCKALFVVEVNTLGGACACFPRGHDNAQRHVPGDARSRSLITTCDVVRNGLKIAGLSAALALHVALFGGGNYQLDAVLSLPPPSPK